MLNQELVEHNALQSQRRASLMKMMGNTTDGAFQRIFTPGTALIKFEIILDVYINYITPEVPLFATPKLVKKVLRKRGTVAKRGQCPDKL